MTNKELRLKNNLTQAQAAELTNIPLRTYKLYENDPAKEGSIKYNYIAETLQQYGLIDETHGILTLDNIVDNVTKVLLQHDIEYAILFGSYASGTATGKSDVDLLISTKVTGIKFFSMAEELRKALKKKVDLLDINQLSNNPELLNNILKEGKRIYVQNK